jgi:hypothetical protein
MLWNQKGTDPGSLLFARMAASYNIFTGQRPHGGLQHVTIFLLLRIFW